MRVSGKRMFWIYILVMLISRPLSYIIYGYVRRRGVGRATRLVYEPTTRIFSSRLKPLTGRSAVPAFGEHCL